ncbi:MAG TPA: PLP-dependent lyase/thiolase [Gemmataceae bacterium]|jgi:threonine dehydratase
MLAAIPTPLVRLSHLFADRAVYAKCEHLAPSGCFKIRGALHLLNRLRREGRTPPLVVPSMGNTALGIAVGARAFGVPVTGVVPQSIGRDKDEKLHALGVELIKVSGDCNELLSRAGEVARERGAYFVHPHLDPLWTDGYQVIVEEVLRDLPDCRSLVFPVGGGGLLMGLTEYLRRRPAPIRLIGCEAYNFPTYARYDHARTRTIADGLVLDNPHPAVRERIAADAVDLRLVSDEEICTAMAELYRKQGLIVEPSSAITVALVRAHAEKIEGPICVILTGSNIAWEDFAHLTQLGENFHKRDGIR